MEVLKDSIQFEFWSLLESTDITRYVTIVGNGKIIPSLFPIPKYEFVPVTMVIASDAIFSL